VTHFHKGMETRFREAGRDVEDVTERPLRSLQSKWGEINHDCNKFTGNLSTVLELDQSGMNFAQKPRQIDFVAGPGCVLLYVWVETVSSSHVERQCI
jgi:hypothetical protein